jgi:hypothetical protein
MYFIQFCFFCRPSDSTVSEDAGIEPRTVATLALTVESLATRVDLIDHSQHFIALLIYIISGSRLVHCTTSRIFYFLFDLFLFLRKYFLSVLKTKKFSEIFLFEIIFRSFSQKSVKELFVHFLLLDPDLDQVGEPNNVDSDPKHCFSF